MAVLQVYSFEDGTSQGIAASSGGTLVGSTVAATTVRKYEGTYALRHTSSGTGTIEMAASVGSRIPVSAGTKVRMTLYAREGSAQRAHTFSLAFYDSAGAFLATAGSNYAAGAISQTSWTALEPVISSTAPANTATMGFVASASSTVSGNYYDIDLVTIETTGEHFSTDPLHETFNKADGTDLGPELTWNNNLQISNRTALGFSITANRLTHTPASSTSIARVENVVPDNQAAAFDLHAIPSDIKYGMGAMVRVDTSTGPTTYYVLRIQGNGTYSIWKRVNNTLTDLVADAAISGGLGSLPGRARLEMEDSTLRAYWRGTLLHSRTDTSITTGRLGLWGSNGNSEILIDDYTGGGLTKTIKLTGRVGPVALKFGTTQKTFAGSATLSGVLESIRAITKTFTATVAPAGAFQRSFTGTVTGTIALAGSSVRQAGKVLSGSSTPSGWLRRDPVREFVGTISTTSALVTSFLGRVVGRAGSAIMSLRAAGEARMRFRRR